MHFCFLLEARPLSTQNADKDRYVAATIYIAVVLNQCLKNTQNIRYVWTPGDESHFKRPGTPNMHSSPLCSNFNPVTRYMRYQLNYLLILYVVPSSEQKYYCFDCGLHPISNLFGKYVKDLKNRFSPLY